MLASARNERKSTKSGSEICKMILYCQTKAGNLCKYDKEKGLNYIKIERCDVDNYMFFASKLHLQ